MPIITITTDFGISDPYLAQLKGIIYSSCPNATVVEVSTQIKPYDILQASFFISHIENYYQEGTIHISTVNNKGEKKVPYIIAVKNNQYFIVPDNGTIFILTQDQEEIDIYTLENDNNLSSKQYLKEAIRMLGLGLHPNQFAIQKKEVRKSMLPAPITHPNFIRGSIIHIDRFQNAILNVSRKLVDKFAKGRKVLVRFSNFQPIYGIKENYYDAPQGELIARYNSHNFVELAINMGRAAQLFGLEKGQLIELVFEE